MNKIDLGLKFSSLSRRPRTEGIILHHYAIKGEASVQAVHESHKKRGWAGIGYHYVVNKDGRVYIGRPEDMIGAHAEGHNSYSIGIAAQGDYSTETMPEVQKQAIIDLIADIKSRRGNLYVKGHRDVNATSCPGKNYPFQEIVNAKPIVIEPIKATPKPIEAINSIKAVQSYLNMKIGANLDIDGYWGPNTRRALIKYWQKVVGGLDVDGSFGPKSKAAASRNNVSKGNKGELVKIMQMALICKAHNLNPYGADGSFGQDTEKELKAYQAHRGLGADGICGTKTWTSLFN